MPCGWGCWGTGDDARSNVKKPPGRPHRDRAKQRRRKSGRVMDTDRLARSWGGVRLVNDVCSRPHGEEE